MIAQNLDVHLVFNVLSYPLKCSEEYLLLKTWTNKHLIFADTKLDPQIPDDKTWHKAFNLSFQITDTALLTFFFTDIGIVLFCFT